VRVCELELGRVDVGMDRLTTFLPAQASAMQESARTVVPGQALATEPTRLEVKQDTLGSTNVMIVVLC